MLWERLFLEPFLVNYDNNSRGRYMLEIEKTVDLDRDLYKDAVAIREQVFVNEQGIPIEKEMKGEDGPCYYVGYVDSHPVATARVIKKTNEWLIQRVAVIFEERNKHYGTEMMEQIEQDALAQQAGRLILHAQDDVQSFYTQLGYQVEGDQFEEADLPHHVMTKDL